MSQLSTTALGSGEEGFRAIDHGQQLCIKTDCRGLVPQTCVPPGLLMGDT